MAQLEGESVPVELECRTIALPDMETHIARVICVHHGHLCGTSEGIILAPLATTAIGHGRIRDWFINLVASPSFLCVLKTASEVICPCGSLASSSLQQRERES